jgi:hypothetical protein
MSTAKAVGEGMDEVLKVMKAGVLCCDVQTAWQAVLDQYGLEKKPDRIFYWAWLLA